MVTIPEIIRTDPTLAALAEAGDFAGIAAAWPAQRLPDVRVGGGGTMDALLANGQTLADINAIYAAIKSLPVGEGLLTLLNASDGVNWCDPKTVALLQSLASQPDSPITDEVIAVLTALSYRAEPTPTAQQIADAMAQQARETLIAATLAPIQAAQAAAATRLNNATATLEDTDGLTLEELQTLCDAVASSADGLGE